MAESPPFQIIDIPIEYGTVPNPDAHKNPPPLLTKTLDSLASFPSIQRFQQKHSTVTDQNANHLRSIHERHHSSPKGPPPTRFIKIRRSPSVNEEEMLKASIKLQAYPPSSILAGRKAEDEKLGTTVASYLDTFHPEHHHHRQSHQPNGGTISNEFVTKKRNFFSKQIATPATVSDDEPTCEEFPQKLSSKSSRRKSAPHDGTPKVTITGVTAIDPPVPSDLPTSFYLLRQSQESLVLKRKPRATSETSSGDSEARSPSYRTIIKFSKNRQIVPDSPDRPLPHAVLKPGEVLRKNSTSIVENPSPQQQPHQPHRDSPTPDLLRIGKFPSESLNGEPLSPSIIRQQCDEIYRIVQNHRFQVYSDGPESGYNTLKEAPPLTRMHSNGSNSIGKISPLQNGGGGLPPMQHLLQVDFSSSSLPEPFKPNHQNINAIENKEAEIERLQRELYDAQVCNYRLNAHMGQLVSKDWKREESELKKSLKDKSSEIENLKKRLEKAERDRRNLESKQPPNVQALQGEKRELQIALEREESEKHELFMQINKLIGELADLRGNATENAAAKDLRQEIDQLRGQLQIAEHERDAIQKSISNLEAEKNAAHEELYVVKTEMEKLKANAEAEKQKLRQEIAEHQKEVQIKSAALQSLRLAKPTSEPSTSAEEFDRMVQEKNQLAQELEAKKKEIQELSRSESDKQKALEISEAKLKGMERDLEEFRQKVDSLQNELSQKSHEIEAFKSQAISSTTSATAKVDEIQEKFENAQRKILQLEQSLDFATKNGNELENEVAEMEEKLAQAEDTCDELSKEIQKLQENGKSDELRISSELQMAKDSISTRDKEIENERKKIKEMEDSMKKLKEEVDNYKNEIASLNEDVQKRSTEISQSTSTIHELQTRISQLEKENNKLMEKASVEEELMTLVNSLQEARARITLKENEIHELRQRMNDQQDETDKIASELRQTLSALERAEEECRKFAETDVELAEYRREAEKRLEECRRDMNEEIVRAKSESHKLQNELESSKKAISKAEIEIKDLANHSETRLEKLRGVEFEKGRLETKIVEYESEIESLQDDLTRLQQSQSEVAQSGEKELAKVREALKSAEKVAESNKKEIQKLENELRESQAREDTNAKEIADAKSQIAVLDERIYQIKNEKGQLEADLRDAETRHATFSKEGADFKTLITEHESTISKLKAEKHQLETDLHESRSRETANSKESVALMAQIAGFEASISHIKSEKAQIEADLHEAENRHATYSKEGADFKSLIADLESNISQLKTEKRQLESDLHESKHREEMHSKEGANSKSLLENLEIKIAQIQKEKSEVEHELLEAKKMHHGSESSKDSEISKLKKELTEKDAQLQQLTTTALELDVIRSSLNEQHSKLGVMEQERSLLADKLQETKNALERKQAELEAEQQASLSKMGHQESALKLELEKVKREKETLESELSNQKELVSDLKRSHDRLNENLQRFTEIMAADGKRFDTVSKEKDILLQEKQILADNLRRTEERIKAYENEIEELRSAANSPPLGDEAELRRKISELTEENARFAANLLKQGGDESAQFRAEYEKLLHEKQRHWSQEKETLLRKIEEQEHDIQKLNQAKVDLETDLQRVKISSYNHDTLTPIPKPRRANTSLTNLTMDTYSERSITPSADEEEVRKLRVELDKQKRIVTVLRKKLQQQQVETLRQQQHNKTSSTASSIH